MCFCTTCIAIDDDNFFRKYIKIGYPLTKDQIPPVLTFSMIYIFVILFIKEKDEKS